MSVARKILREKEANGELIPYIRESGFVVYTTRAELDKRERGAPVMIADALEEVASSVPEQPVITEEMDEALTAAGTPEAVKPSKLARKRREAGERKERKDMRPEVIVEPLDVAETTRVPISEPEPKKATEKKEEKPKKTPKKAAEKKEEKPKKASTKAAEKKEEKPKKTPTKAAEKKEEKPKKTPTKAADKKDDKPKKASKK